MKIIGRLKPHKTSATVKTGIEIMARYGVLEFSSTSSVDIRRGDHAEAMKYIGPQRMSGGQILWGLLSIMENFRSSCLS